MNEAFSFAIETKREIIAFDLIHFSVKHALNLSFDEKSMQLLIKGKMFNLIEDIVNAHAVLKIEQSLKAGTMEAMEVFK